MKITCISIGKTDEDYLRAGIQKYIDRLKFYSTITCIEIPDIQKSKKLSIQEQKKQECEKIIKKIPAQSSVFLLDEKGTQYTSINFSNIIDNCNNTGIKEICFIIGGPYGFSDDMYKKGYKKISFSKMTFSHQMIRLFLFEQIYRAYTIINGTPYHHE